MRDPEDPKNWVTGMIHKAVFTLLLPIESTVCKEAFPANKCPESRWVQHPPSSKTGSSLTKAMVQKSRQGIPAHLGRYEPLNL